MHWNVYGSGVNIDIVHMPDCPNLAVARDRLNKALDGTALTAAVREVEVTTVAHAARAGLRGSPTILIDGHDPFGGDGLATSLSCRLYRNDDGFDGAPTVAQLIDALAR